MSDTLRVTGHVKLPAAASENQNLGASPKPPAIAALRAASRWPWTAPDNKTVGLAASRWPCRAIDGQPRLPENRGALPHTPKAKSPIRGFFCLQGAEYQRRGFKQRDTREKILMGAKSSVYIRGTAPDTPFKFQEQKQPVMSRAGARLHSGCKRLRPLPP